MIAHLDCSSGVSGDKFLGALVDAGLPEAELRSAVSRLALPTDALRIERVRSHGIAAVSIRLEGYADAGAAPPAANMHTPTGVPTRHLAEIRELIAGAGLAERVAARAVATFETLAQAEARVHGASVDEVHFHEVGAADALLDIVGVALGIEMLGIDSLVATPPALGGGTVATSHGTLPVPAPATAQLLLGVPTSSGPAAIPGTDVGELTTPTGAALLREFATGFGPCPPLTPARIGYGAGTRDIGSPNVCRIIVGEAAVTPVALSTETVVLLETNIDHISAEEAAFACEQLLAEGALDVWQSPALMKKGRAAFVLSVLCPGTVADAMAERVVALTGTLGARRTDLARYVAGRAERVVQTAWGPIRFKVGPEGATHWLRPEFDDVARIARETGRTFGDVARELTQLAAQDSPDP